MGQPFRIYVGKSYCFLKRGSVFTRLHLIFVNRGSIFVKPTAIFLKRGAIFLKQGLKTQIGR